MPERRKFIRINVLSDVSIVPVNDPNATPVKAVIVNLSAAGIGVITNGNFAIDTPIHISFSLPSGPSFKNIEGQIVRADTIAQKHYIFIGIDLGRLTQEQKNILNKYVMELRHKHYSMKLGL
jgi:c-di-GMP-binding flagellar brake protein YcgR